MSQLLSIYTHHMGETSPRQEVFDLAFFNTEVSPLTG
jgi:hypothetical protein